MGMGKKVKGKIKPSRVHTIKESAGSKVNKMISENYMDDMDESKFDEMTYEQEMLRQALGDDLYAEMESSMENGAELSDQILDALVDYYTDSGEMPYEVAKAREGDPYVWVQDRVEKMFALTTPKQSDDEMEEGNAFTGALEKARADGVEPGETMKVGGEEYPVHKNESSLAEMKRLAGLQECGLGQMAPTEVQPSRLDVSTSMSSDGNKTMTVTASGDQAEPDAGKATGGDEQRRHSGAQPDPRHQQERQAAFRAAACGGDGQRNGQSGIRADPDR